MTARSPVALVIGLVLLVRLLLVATIDPAYGFHRDELLYFAMADHLDLWRMQFPPFIALVGGVSLALLGDTSVLAARVPAALGATALTLVALLVARRLGARLPALALVAVALLAAPITVRPGVLMHPVVFDQLWYAVAALGLLRAATDDDPRAGWMVLGIGLGLGGLTKFSVAFHAVAMIAATLATPGLRRQLATRWPWMATSLALSIALPAFTGQAVHGWPIVVQADALQSGQLQHTGYGAYLTEQVLMLGGAALVALAGIVGLLRVPALAPARPLGVAALVVVLLFLVMNGKGYYAGPAYVPLVAVGAVALQSLPARWRFALPVSFAVQVAAGVAFLPAGVPVLDPPRMMRYAASLGITRTNYGTTLSLPQDYADMTGWREQAEATAEAWRALSDEDRRDAVVVGGNYGQAGALARFGPSLGLPYPVSLAGDFWAWGSGSPTARHLLALGPSPDDLRPFCERVVLVQRVRNPLGVDEEQDVPLSFCRGLREPLPVIWARLGPQWG